MRLSVPKPNRTVSTGELIMTAADAKMFKSRRALSFRERAKLPVPIDEDDDDDENKIEIVEGAADEFFEMPKLKELDEAKKEGEMLYESFVLPESDGFSLDYI